MLLKKTLEYRNHNVSFSRIKMNERINSGKSFLGCHGCGFLDRGACVLKYERNIKIDYMKCGFGYIWSGEDVMYKYVAKEGIGM